MSDKKPEPYGEEVKKAAEKVVRDNQTKVDDALKKAERLADEMIKRSQSQPKK